MSQTRSSRGNPAMGDIMRSMFVIGLLILALYGFGKLFTSTPDTPTSSVDYTATAAEARPAVGFDLLAPPTLPAGWTATSARYQIGAWHLGVLTSDKKYVGLEQVKQSESRAVERFAAGSVADGTAVIDGVTWSKREGPQKRLTLVRSEGGVTTLLNGTASQKQFETYIGTLATS